MNIVSISGRLVYEPELKTTSNGTNYMSSRIAVERHDKDKNTDFFTFRAYGKSAEFIKKYFHKGYPVELSGKLQTSSYEKQDGTKVNETYIFVSEVGFVLKSQTENQTQAPAEGPQTDPSLPFEI